MKKQATKSKSGFTIIEVVLVLAIAGLIFLMVFVALPALQRSQRDTQRRDDYASLSTAVTNYMTNNNGRLPMGTTSGTCATGFGITQINSTGQDPNGKDYVLQCVTSVPTNVSAYNNNNATNGATVYVIRGATCNNGTPQINNGDNNANTRKFAVYGQLESGTYCNSSS